MECTVNDLIEHLKKFNPDTPIAISGENGPWTLDKSELSSVVFINPKLDILNDVPLKKYKEIVLILA